jgi:hypothetical protein
VASLRNFLHITLPMKRLYSIFAAAILSATSVLVLVAQAGVQVSVDFFHDNLESYGDWREVGDYGYCWQPRDVDRDWRPYSDGRWLYTDAGWTWDSDEPYGWAVYHYGRWARIDHVGWVWVPGTEWGPAWVSWRRSPRYVGWAPLPPEARFVRSSGFSARVDADYDIGPANYSFVQVRNFGAPRLRTVIVEPRENITIIRQTTNITRITYVNNVVYNDGPQYDVISRESAQPIRRLKLDRREEFGGDLRTVRSEQLRTRVEGDSLRVVALPFDTAPATAPRKVAAKVENAEVNHGWKNAGPPAEVAKLRAKIKSEPGTASEQPPQPKAGNTAQASAPASVSSTVPDEEPAKGKGRKGGPPPSPAAPVATEAAPASSEMSIVPKRNAKGKASGGGKPMSPAARDAAEAVAVSPEEPVAPDKSATPGKPQSGARPLKPEGARVRPSQPTVDEAAPSSQAKKGRNKGSEAARPPEEAAPREQVQGRKPKSENVQPPRNLPPAAVEMPRQKTHPGKGEAQPKPEQPGVRSTERKVPSRPEPRSQAKNPDTRQHAVPAVVQPQPPQPAKGKSKSKGKDEKKDGVKAEGVPQ